MGAEIMVRTYSGADRADAARRYGEDAPVLAGEGWVPITQVWVAGDWSSGQYLLAVILVPFVIGIGLLILFTVVKPTRTLMVTYQRPLDGGAGDA